MYFYKELYADGTIRALSTYYIRRPNITKPLLVEITESEYNGLLQEIQDKEILVNSLYSGTITIEDVPAEWREEIQRRVAEMIAHQGVAEDQDIPAEEALDIILGVST